MHNRYKHFHIFTPNASFYGYGSAVFSDKGSATNSQPTDARTAGDQVYRTRQSKNRERIAEPTLLTTAKRAHGPSPTPRVFDDFFPRQCFKPINSQAPHNPAAFTGCGGTVLSLPGVKTPLTKASPTNLETRRAGQYTCISFNDPLNKRSVKTETHHSVADGL